MTANDQPTGYYMEFRPTRMQRLWRALGFRHPYLEPQDLRWDEGDQVRIETVAMLDWRDRLRVLVSGRIAVTTVTDISGKPGECVTRSAVGILTHKGAQL